MKFDLSKILHEGEVKGNRLELGIPSGAGEMAVRKGTRFPGRSLIFLPCERT